MLDSSTHIPTVKMEVMTKLASPITGPTFCQREAASILKKHINSILMRIAALKTTVETAEDLKVAKTSLVSM